MPQPLRVDDTLQKARREIGASDFEICEPNKLQIANAARVKDAYRVRKRRPLWITELGYALMVLVLLILSFSALFIIAEALR